MIGVYGGTFDPVHVGHLRTALEIKEVLQLEKILFVPCAQPPHRKAPVICPESRARMLELAVRTQPGFHVERLEIEREGYSYTVDTLASLRKQYEDKILCLILGMDAFLGLPQWNRWQSLFDLSHLVVMCRPGTRKMFPEQLERVVDQRQTLTAATLRTRRNGSIFFQQVTQLDISATEIRNSIKQGYSPRFLLPENVWAMIQELKLYQ